PADRRSGITRRGTLAPMCRLVEAGHTATERGANERAFLALDDAADAGAGAGRSADDERALPPRPMRARRATRRLVPYTRRRRAGHAVGDACDSRDGLAANEPHTNDRVLARPAGHDDGIRERLNAAETR